MKDAAYVTRLNRGTQLTIPLKPTLVSPEKVELQNEESQPTIQTVKEEPMDIIVIDDGNNE